MAESGATTARTTWTYDAAYQLTGEHRTGTNAFRHTYTYDTRGNRTLKNLDGARTTSTYDAANQLKWTDDGSGRTTYTFDADGNQQVVRAPNGDRTTYVWDYENRMTSVQLPAGIRNRGVPSGTVCLSGSSGAGVRRGVPGIVPPRGAAAEAWVPEPSFPGGVERRFRGTILFLIRDAGEECPPRNERRRSDPPAKARSRGAAHDRRNQRRTIRSMPPMYGRSASGTSTVPSSRW